MPKAIVIEKFGPASVMKWRDVKIGKPKKGEAQVRHTAVGLNYIDVYQRTGLYPMTLPSDIGLEGAGVVEAVGLGVSHVKPGDRVAYAGGPPGAYAEVRNMPAARLVKIHKGIKDQTAAAMMLQGMTVEYLLCQTFRVQKGMPVLFHAAAGGVGLIAGQWLKAIGAVGIGTAGGKAKCELAKKHGFKHVIDYTKKDVAREVRKLTNGEGVPVVYDAVGKDTWGGSLNSLARRGMMVSFGNASGPVPAVMPLLLSQKGSLFLTRPTLFDYTFTRGDLEKSARSLFRMVASKKVRIKVNQTYALKDAAKAHRDLQGRKTTGSTVLIP